MHRNASLPDKKIKSFLATGHSPLPDPSRTGEGDAPPQTSPLGARRSRSFSFTTRTLGILIAELYLRFCNQLD